MRDFSQDHRWLSINTATVRKQRGRGLAAAADPRCLRGARHPRHLAVARPGRRRRARRDRAAGEGARARARPAIAAAACSPHADAAVTPGGARRQPPRARRSLHAERRLPGAGGRRLPGALRRQAGAPRHRAGARAGHRRHRRAARSTRAQRRMPLAIEPLHPMYAADRACINTLEQALDVCDALDPETATGRARASRVDAYHVWWDPKLHAQIARAGKQRLLALHVCDWLVPTTDLLNDRGMMGDGVIDSESAARVGRSAGLRRLQRGRDLLGRQLVAARRRRGARHLHRAAPALRVARAATQPRASAAIMRCMKPSVCAGSIQRSTTTASCAGSIHTRWPPAPTMQYALRRRAGKRAAVARCSHTSQP